MNRIVIGLADKTEALTPEKPGFLLLDDGPIADTFLHTFKRAKEFNPHSHSFNPLPMTYRNAREFASIVYGEEGKDTLTARNGKRALTKMLMHADRIDSLYGGRSDAEKEAIAIIDDLLLSPVLKKVLCGTPMRWMFSGASVVARLDRTDIGEHDARILGALLISQFKRQVIIPDFGFYARDFHSALIREDRLIAGVYTLSELEPTLRHLCLLMEKTGMQCTFEDAEVLAKYAGLRPTTEGYNGYVLKAMR